MNRPLLAAAALAFAALPALARAQSAFDGAWRVTISCPAVADAVGYTLRFPARVTGGVFEGENGTPGAAGYLHLTGRVQPDGTAMLDAAGLVGNPRTAVGRIPTLSPYHYVASTRFTGDHGTGTRTSVRPCSLDFVRG